MQFKSIYGIGSPQSGAGLKLYPQSGYSGWQPSGVTPRGSYGYDSNGNPNPGPDKLPDYNYAGGRSVNNLGYPQQVGPPRTASGTGSGSAGSAMTSSGRYSLNSGSNTTGLVYPGDRGNPADTSISTLARVKNPGIDALNTSQQGQIASNGAQNQNDIGAYTQAIADNAQGNKTYFGQESGAINNFYDGTNLSNLNRTNSRYYDTAGNLITGAAGDLSSALDRYKTSEGGAIQGEATARAGMEGAYKSTAQGQLDQAIKDLSAQRDKYATAATAGTNLSIAQADAQRKSADAVTGGGGGGSYFARQGIQVRNAANVALQQDLANRQRTDYGLTNAEQVALNQDMADRSRADYGLTREESARLNSNVTAQQRGDIGFTYGQRAGLESTNLNNNLNSQRYVYDTQGRLLGVRGQLSNQNANYLLNPMNARNAALGAQFAQLGQATNIDQANRFYGLNDNGASNPSFNPGGIQLGNVRSGGNLSYTGGGGGGGGGRQYSLPGPSGGGSGQNRYQQAMESDPNNIDPVTGAYIGPMYDQNGNQRAGTDLRGGPYQAPQQAQYDDFTGAYIDPSSITQSDHPDFQGA